VLFEKNSLFDKIKKQGATGKEQSTTTPVPSKAKV